MEGKGGSGKTLLALDIAKDKKNKDKRILFIFCGAMRPEHQDFDKYLSNVTFISAKFIDKEDLSAFEIILIDESQRIRTEQMKKLYKLKDEFPKTLIVLFFDKNQILSPKDEGQSLITSNFNSGEVLSLTENVRSNKYIDAFVDRLFNLNNAPKKEIYLEKLREIVNVKYFDSYEDAKPWIKGLNNKNFTFIRPIPDSFHESSSDNFEDIGGKKTDEAIGREYDNVVTYVDNKVKYNSRGILQNTSNEYYDLKNEFYVNISRARDHLALAVIGNQDLYNAIMQVVFPQTKNELIQ